MEGDARVGVRSTWIRINESSRFPDSEAGKRPREYRKMKLGLGNGELDWQSEVSMWDDLGVLNKERQKELNGKAVESRGLEGGIGVR